MINKRGILGESIVLLYRFLLITLIAFIVLGISSTFYPVKIDIRDSEAKLMTVLVSECLSEEGFFDYNLFKKMEKGNLLEYCNISFSDRFYVNVLVYLEEEELLFEGYQGDRGLLWVKDFLDRGYSKEIEKYNPGYYNFEYPTKVFNEDKFLDGSIKMEVLVKSDE